MFKMSTSGRNSCPQPKSPPINRLINDQSDIASAYQCLAQDIDGCTPVALPRFCNQQDEIKHVKKPQV